MPDPLNSSHGMSLGPAAWAPTPQGRMPEAECSKPPACPACGGLECLCRPRFFAGQLLTEDDLNRLENYVVGKNKLHNRYLHGWGVVCGLEVVCDPCGEGVVVRPGYALAPCGEDIVVCDDQTVDVCALIQACLPVQTPCAPSGGWVTPATPAGTSTATDPCADAVDPWVLAICYDERPSRGVMPLRQPSGSCGCGQGGGCGCGAKSKKAGCGCGARNGSSCGCAKGSQATKNRGTYATRGASAVACEPTLICEGYRFIAYKAPKGNPAGVGGFGFGNLAGTATAGRGFERVLCSWQALMAGFEKVPKAATSATELFRWCCDMRTALIDFVTTHATYDCGLAARARALVCPDPANTPNAPGFEAAFQAAVNAMVDIGATYMRNYLCQALLPPCPDPIDGDCVPLATINVRRSDCHIVDVCNWGPRKLALTFPQIQHWLSPLHLGEALGRAIERVCCTPLRPVRAVNLPGTVTNPAPPIAAHAPGGPSATGIPPVVAPAAGAATDDQAQNASQAAILLAAQAFGNKARPVDAAMVLLDALGFVSDENRPLLSPLERANPVTFLLANQVLQPFISSLLPGGETGPLGATTVGPAAAHVREAPAGDHLAELRRMIDALTSTVTAQGKEIKKLRTRRPPER